jgi:hypothetical protein
MAGVGSDVPDSTFAIGAFVMAERFESAERLLSPANCPAPPPEPEPEAGDAGAPETTIAKGPSGKTKSKSATFEFNGTDARVVSGFECKLDTGAFAPCTSPFTVKVKKGKHTFQVRATDAAGNVDPTPATRSWTVKKKKRKK